MPSSASSVAGAVDRDRLLRLELELIRIPSSAFAEHAIADFLADTMKRIGLEVEMMAVDDPKVHGQQSRQPIGRLRGTGGGASLMLNGHMDPGVEMSGWSVDPYAGIIDDDGWIWGIGAHDDKGGVAAMISAIEAIVRSGMRLKGDVLVCPVVAHKYGGVGTRALLQAGVRADRCINLEHSANTIANVLVGIVMARIRTVAPELFFRFSAAARARYMNPVEQQMEILRRIGPSLTPIAPGGWLEFTPHPELPGFPMLTVDTIHKEHYYQPNMTGMSSRECEMVFQLRTVPGQTLASVRMDLERLLAEIRAEHPAFDCQLTIPAGGPGDCWFQDPVDLARDGPLVQALAEGQRLASGQEAVIGGFGRLGNVGDGNILAAAGIPSVQYGPGDIRIYREWPTPDERVRLADLETAARAVAYATCVLCS
jgi:acetylornithine deacetylase